MRQILETEEHVPIPPIMYSDPFYRITYLIKEEIRKYKWIEGEKGRKLSWERARQEWADAYRETFEKFLIDTLYFPDATPPEEPPAEGRAKPGMATATGNAMQPDVVEPLDSTFDGACLARPPSPRRSREPLKHG